MTGPVARIRSTAFRRGSRSAAERAIPEEAAVAFTYDGGAHAVMMATPRDLEDLAVGFTLTEGIVAAPGEIRDLAVIEEAAGIELRMWLSEAKGAALRDRRRHLRARMRLRHQRRRRHHGALEPRGGVRREPHQDQAHHGGLPAMILIVDNYDSFVHNVARYFEELEAKPEALAQLRAYLARGPVTLLYGARDEEHNNAVALRDFVLHGRSHRSHPA